MKRKIVESISIRQIARFLEEVDLKPHRSRYWLNSKAKETDPVGFARDERAVCDTYAGATRALMRGEHVMSTDEKTGIQALERVAPTKPAVPGKIESVEFE
ncbi:MAG: hypothetical protein H0V89_07460 [Deltaproteobacteria bacterium]|nr:hypothetical protein [Deltaproteobacteria bacterium]